MKILKTNLNRLLYLRPHELTNYITKMKVLYKYSRLSQDKIKSHETFFSDVFRNTCYPFSWNLHYEKETKQEMKDYYLSVEKKILFRFEQTKSN